MVAAGTTKYKPKVLLEKSAFKINTTIYVNYSTGIYAIKINPCPEKERDEEKDKVKQDHLAHANLKDNSGLFKTWVMFL